MDRVVRMMRVRFPPCHDIRSGVGLAGAVCATGQLEGNSRVAVDNEVAPDSCRHCQSNLRTCEERLTLECGNEILLETWMIFVGVEVSTSVEIVVSGRH